LGVVPLQDVGYLSLYEMFSVEGKKVGYRYKLSL
jgi:hypothetical protein